MVFVGPTPGFSRASHVRIVAGLSRTDHRGPSLPGFRALVDLAGGIGASGFAFVLATLFGASAAFATPIGYHTNLMVYGPGGYRFTDFARVGLPLQMLLSVVTALGILLLYPV